jgi:hypothetical protein
MLRFANDAELGQTVRAGQRRICRNERNRAGLTEMPSGNEDQKRS